MERARPLVVRQEPAVVAGLAFRVVAKVLFRPALLWVVALVRPLAKEVAVFQVRWPAGARAWVFPLDGEEMVVPVECARASWRRMVPVQRARRAAWRPAPYARSKWVEK